MTFEDFLLLEHRLGTRNFTMQVMEGPLGNLIVVTGISGRHKNFSVSGDQVIALTEPVDSQEKPQ